MRWKKPFAVLFLLLFVPGWVPAWADVVTISVAGSMTDAFKKLAATFEEAHPDITVRLNFASSGALAKQIIQGAPADIFVSANTRWMDYLVDQNKVERADVRIFAYNTLVFAGDKNTPAKSLAHLEKLDRIGLGSPASVPAGQYAEEAMRAAGIYDKLLAAQKFIMAKDVRQALLYADRGEADGAFVYKTDALLAERAVILFTVPQELYTRVSYPVALTKAGKEKAEAQIVYDFINGKEALTILESLGFTGP
ncbi:MAG: molybdate ABC transporter substrate-binding protein [Thermodesulfobacteriota bacterium]|nr:molybdate ABC transporter substrate-binding protein [Thermodesulfobacteriota bacterium]